jgi:serine/threonine protein phosphatase 1
LKETVKAAPAHDRVCAAAPDRRHNSSRLICAVGDVHGQVGRLEALLAHLKRYCGIEGFQLVFVGDYVDRGPGSRAVVELLIDLQRRAPERTICLRGNHEAVVVAAAKGLLHTLPDQVDLELWLGPAGGGLQTLESYGVAQPAELPSEHLDWMASLPLFHDDGERLFVHAGIRPDINLSDQTEDDLLWIREPFLSHAAPFERLVVHGHTPVPTRVPDVRRNRLNLDTGAGYGGPLTAAIFQEGRHEPVAFLTDQGELPADKLSSSAQARDR